MHRKIRQYTYRTNKNKNIKTDDVTCIFISNIKFRSDDVKENLRLSSKIVCKVRDLPVEKIVGWTGRGKKSHVKSSKKSKPDSVSGDRMQKHCCEMAHFPAIRGRIDEF